MKTDIIFDLDGTLIESSAGILAAFESAFSVCGKIPTRALTSAIVGPPLMETLSDLTGTDDPAVLQPLAAAFKAHYDTAGYRLTTVFPGIVEMLSDLRERGFKLYIATNKRSLPTHLIVQHLGWADVFAGVYALDSFQPPLTSKAHMLGEVLGRCGLDPQHSLYVGDRNEDGEAARSNHIPFLLAVWGYAEAHDGRWEILPSPEDLLKRL